MVRLKNEGADVVTEALKSPREQIVKFQNKTQDVVSALVTNVIPELTAALDDVGDALEDLIPLAKIVGRAIAAAFRLAMIPEAGFGKLIGNIAEGNWSEVLKFDPSGFDKLKDIFADAFAPLEKPQLPTRQNGKPLFEPNARFKWRRYWYF